MHWAVADYLQRAARHIASKTDVEQAYAVGEAAVEFALRGMNAVMPTIVRTSMRPTAGRSARRRSRSRQPRKDAAGFIPQGRLPHHRRRARYLEPLIRGEAPRPTGATACRGTW